MVRELGCWRVGVRYGKLTNKTHRPLSTWVIGCLLLIWAGPGQADLRSDDTNAYRAAVTHGSAAAFKSYLQHCRVCSHRISAAQRLSGLQAPRRVAAKASVQTVVISYGNSTGIKPRLDLVRPGQQPFLMGRSSRMYQRSTNLFLADADKGR